MWGCRLLECAALIQPDVRWCSGLTELVKTAGRAAARNVMPVPHCTGVCSYHLVITRMHSPFAEFLMRAPAADQVIPMMAPILLDEPPPEGDMIRLPDRPGFGVRLNPDFALQRPFPR